MANYSSTVFVVEPQAVLRAAVRKALVTNGYRVLATANGKDALRMAAWHDDEVTLLATDMIVPGFDGGHLAELLTLGSPQLKVLYLDSGRASRTDTERHLHGLAWDATIIPLHERGWARALVRAVRDALRTIGAATWKAKRWPIA
jgi:DNA-binding NtrC family response regulator